MTGAEGCSLVWLRAGMRNGCTSATIWRQVEEIDRAKFVYRDR